MAATRRRRLVAWLVFAISGVALPATAGAVRRDVGAGVSVAEPTGLAAVQNPPAPVSAAWQSAAGDLTVEAILIPVSQVSLAEAAKEYQDWPGVGRSMANGFGNANAKAVGQALGTTCTFSGVPVKSDAGRLLVHIQVVLTCATAPEPTIVRYELLSALSAGGQVMLRVTGVKAEPGQVEDVVSALWESLEVSKEMRLAAAVAAAGRPPEDAAGARPVAGGAGVRLTDYGLLRPAALFGKAAGAFIGGLAFGALLSWVLVLLGGGPTVSLVVAFVILLVLGIVGDRRDGVWEIDWLCRGAPTVLAALALRKWVGTKWEQRQERRRAKAPGSAPAGAPADPSPAVKVQGDEPG